MSRTIITKKELHVPVGAMLDVADVLVQNQINHEIIGTDSDEDTIIFEVQYEKDERDAIHEIEDLIADYVEDEESEDDDDNNDNDK